ncbi:hypothetical protein [Xanthobacter sediminis]
MANEDQAVAIEVLHANRPGGGDNGRDDWKLLEATHYSTEHDIIWGAIPAECGGLAPRLEEGLATAPGRCV